MSYEVQINRNQFSVCYQRFCHLRVTRMVYLKLKDTLVDVLSYSEARDRNLIAIKELLCRVDE